MNRLLETSDQFFFGFTWPWSTLIFIFESQSLPDISHQYCISFCNWGRDALKLEGGHYCLTCDVLKRADNVHSIPQRWKLLGKTAHHLSFFAPVGRRDTSDRWGQETELSNVRLSHFRETWPSDETFCSAKGKELPVVWAEPGSTGGSILNLAGVLLSLLSPHLDPCFPTNLISNKANFLFTLHLSVFSGVSLSWL